MADFTTHISTSSALGVAYASAGYFMLGMPVPSCLVAGGLCSVSGMLPDIDSDSGVPQRESIGFAAAIVPMLAMERFAQMGLSHEMLAVIGGGAYLFIRFFVGWLIKVYTAHRGMWHSVPAMLIAGLLAFVVASGPTIDVRLFKSCGVILGFFSHLFLDEVWALDFSWGLPRPKKSFGTAIKFWGDSLWGNVLCYSIIGLLAIPAIADPAVLERFGVHDSPTQHMAQQLMDSLKGTEWLR